VGGDEGTGYVRIADDGIEIHLGDSVFGFTDEAALHLADALWEAVGHRLTIEHYRGRAACQS
jgi:hypothetical protein